jgi:hypothetical protein
VLASPFTFFSFTPFTRISLASCNHYNLASFLWSNILEYPTSNHDVCFRSPLRPTFYLAGTSIFTLIAFYGLLIFTLEFKLSKVVNLFDATTRNCSLPSASFILNLDLLTLNLCVLCLLIAISPKGLLLPDSGRYHSPLLWKCACAAISLLNYWQFDCQPLHQRMCKSICGCYVVGSFFFWLRNF